MDGLMQSAALLTSATLAHAARIYPEVEIASARHGKVIARTTYAEVDARARRLADALVRDGLADESTVLGALGFNTSRLLEVMHAVPGTGAVLHTANPRLPLEHLAYCIEHAGDNTLFVDPECLDLAASLAPLCPNVRHWIVLGDSDAMPSEEVGSALGEVQCYEHLIERGDLGFSWPEFDEGRASTLCFTSATTGPPKGVLYSHRGTLLNILTISGCNGWALGRGDVVLAVAPFFHCNGWGMPYMAPMVGAKLVLPGADVGAEAMLRLIRDERITHTGGVPTVLMDLLTQAEADAGGLGELRRLWTGGTAPPEALVARLEALGPRVMHAFGMTETTQALTVSTPDPNASPSERRRAQLRQGQPIFLSDVRIVDDHGQPLANDGEQVGHLQVRGPAVAAAYFARPDLDPTSADGWLDTGDIACVGQHRELTLRDRSKDAIKSGGEWISSVEIENAAAGCPGITQAACVGVDHPRWQERPLLLVVRAPGHPVDEAAVRAHLAKHIVKWWMPDAIRFVDTLPRNGVGKVMKAELRARYRGILGEFTAS